MAIQYLPVSWLHYVKNAQKLASEILSQTNKPEEIIAIARGGLTLGHMLSDFLRIPISIISIQSYTDIQTQGEVELKTTLQTSIQDKHILLVDDVADTGKTFVRALAYLDTLQPKDIQTVAMYYKERSVHKPNFFSETTSKWVLFPYEPTEMMILLDSSMKKEGKSIEEINAFLRTLQYTDDQISFVRKFHIK